MREGEIFFFFGPRKRQIAFLDKRFPLAFQRGEEIGGRSRPCRKTDRTCQCAFQNGIARYRAEQAVDVDAADREVQGHDVAGDEIALCRSAVQ